MTFLYLVYTLGTVLLGLSLPFHLGPQNTVETHWMVDATGLEPVTPCV